MQNDEKKKYLRNDSFLVTGQQPHIIIACCISCNCFPQVLFLLNIYCAIFLHRTPRAWGISFCPIGDFFLSLPCYGSTTTRVMLNIALAFVTFQFSPVIQCVLTSYDE